MTAPATFIYFLRPVGFLGPIKIGCSLEPKKRLEDFLTWSPFKLEVLATTPGTLHDEGFLHRCFAKSHSHREWFHACPEIERALTVIATGGGILELRAQLAEVGSIRNKRAPLSASVRRLRSYASRIRNAQQRIRKTRAAWYAPKDVRSIISRWDGNRYWDKETGWVTVEPVEPTPEQIARLDEYLADPIAHSIELDWPKPKLVAAQ